MKTIVFWIAVTGYCTAIACTSILILLTCGFIAVGWGKDKTLTWCRKILRLKSG